MAIAPPPPPFTLHSLTEIMRALRDPDGGCPWDLEQDFTSIVPYTIEEAYEVADAIERRDWTGLRDELGDLILQVVYHAHMAQEQQLFDLADVVAAICAKMIRRHPHVFGSGDVASAEAQTHAWDVMKAKEREQSGNTATLDGVARSLPALVRAEKLQRRAARVGFDWRDASGPLAKVREEIDEVRQAQDGSGDVASEIGDVLFSVVNWARHLGVDPEVALRGANARFEQRFAVVEELAEPNSLLDLGIDELERLWQQAKLLTGQSAAP